MKATEWMASNHAYNPEMRLDGNSVPRSKSNSSWTALIVWKQNPMAPQRQQHSHVLVNFVHQQYYQSPPQYQQFVQQMYKNQYGTQELNISMGSTVDSHSSMKSSWNSTEQNPYAPQYLATQINCRARSTSRNLTPSTGKAAKYPQRYITAHPASRISNNSSAHYAPMVSRSR